MEKLIIIIMVLGVLFILIPVIYLIKYFLEKRGIQDYADELKEKDWRKLELLYRVLDNSTNIQLALIFLTISLLLLTIILGILTYIQIETLELTLF